MSTANFNLHLGIIVDTPKPSEVISNVMGVPQTHLFRTECGTKWVYKKIYKNQQDINQCIQEYFASIPDIAEKIKRVRQYGSCVFRVSVVSVFGQFGFSMSESDLKLLSHLDIPMEISIFSFGGCIDDTDCS